MSVAVLSRITEQVPNPSGNSMELGDCKSDRSQPRWNYASDNRVGLASGRIRINEPCRDHSPNYRVGLGVREHGHDESCGNNTSKHSVELVGSISVSDCGCGFNSPNHSVELGSSKSKRCVCCGNHITNNSMELVSERPQLVVGGFFYPSDNGLELDSGFPNGDERSKSDLDNLLMDMGGGKPDCSKSRRCDSAHDAVELECSKSERRCGSESYASCNAVELDINPIHDKSGLQLNAAHTGLALECYSSLGNDDGRSSISSGLCVHRRRSTLGGRNNRIPPLHDLDIADIEMGDHDDGSVSQRSG